MAFIKQRYALEEIKARNKMLEEDKSSDILFTVYGLKNHELGAALVQNDYEYFREMVMNGEAGKILKCICTSRDNAEACVRRMVHGYEAIILTDYDDGDEPYVQLLKDEHSFDL